MAKKSWLARDKKKADTVNMFNAARFAKMKKGALIMVAPWVLHRHQSYWRDPHMFDPDRFLPEREAEMTAAIESMRSRSKIEVLQANLNPAP